jgi:hypothetical protein
MQLQQGLRFRGCSHSLMFRLLNSLGSPVAPTAGTSPRAAEPFTPRNEHGVTRPDRSRFSMNCGITTYPKRTNLIRRDFHPQDRGLVGRYLTPAKPRHGLEHKAVGIDLWRATALGSGGLSDGFPTGLSPAPMAHGSIGPPAIPDGRISRVRF